MCDEPRQTGRCLGPVGDRDLCLISRRVFGERTMGGVGGTQSEMIQEYTHE